MLLIPLKPTFQASKVAALIGRNPFQPQFEELLQVMLRMNIPLGVDPSEKVIDYTRTSYMQHITKNTTIEDIQSFLKTPDPPAPNLQHGPVLLTGEGPPSPRNDPVSLLTEGPPNSGPDSPPGLNDECNGPPSPPPPPPPGPVPTPAQLSAATRLRFGQVAEECSIELLRQQGKYSISQFAQQEFKHFYLTGKTDGRFNNQIVEIKNRTRRFLGVTSYERPQFECYMRLLGQPEMVLCETLKKKSGMEQRLSIVKQDDALWSFIVEKLTMVGQFIGEVQERRFLQQLDKDVLQIYFENFVTENISLSTIKN